MFLTDKKVNRSAGYHEESIRIPVVITVVLLLAITIPLVFWILNINREGTLATDISKYNELVERVGMNLQEVDAMLRNDDKALASMNNPVKGPSVTLIVPEVVLIEEKPEKTEPFSIVLEGIYWSPANPLAGISGETYRVGDKVKGFEIVEISKTSVKFKRPDGSFIVRDMYDNLLQK